MRMMPPGSLEQVVFRMDALHRIAAAGIPVLNPPRAVEAAVDKYLTLSLLDRAGIPVPPTWAGESATEALEVFAALGGDVVVKPLFGSEGRGLVRISDPELAWRTFHALERLNAVLYLQRVVRHPGHDLRVFVLRGSVLGVDAPACKTGRMAHQRLAGRKRRALPARSGGRAACPGRGPRDRSGDGGRRPDRRSRPGPAGRAGGQRGAWLAGPGTRDRNRRRGSDPRGFERYGQVASNHGRPQRPAHRADSQPAATSRLAGSPRAACLLEVNARKPGNVHRFADLPGLHYADFLASAAAIAGPFDEVVSQGVGALVLAAVAATRRVVSTNTNLGIVLLLAPLAVVPEGIDLAEGVEGVLAETTVADACLVYRAIRLAQPGGMGEVGDQDLGGDPTITLRAVMSLAAERDLIARQYANGFREVLDEGLPALRESLRAGHSLETAIVAAYLHLLARLPRLADRPEVRPEPGQRGLAPRRPCTLRRLAGPRRSQTCSATILTSGYASQTTASTRERRPTW